MIKRIISTYLILCIFVCFLAIGCSKTNSTDISREIDKITLGVVSKSELPDGIGYALKLKNSSSYLIKYNTVYICYPARTKTDNNGYGFNRAKFEADGQKIDIHPGEEVMLNVFIPFGIFNSDYVDQSKLMYEIKGYLNQVKEINHFDQIGEL